HPAHNLDRPTNGAQTNRRFHGLFYGKLEGRYLTEILVPFSLRIGEVNIQTLLGKILNPYSMRG
ncbi:MAG: hypothetical protein GTN74_10975, partial [Proteobacteria bacterium]|nr:hypothetical protein [Pseudomonadota bacterium]NIS68883.1 hypothetical protein [Pseudomonadota bacterium]